MPYTRTWTETGLVPFDFRIDGTSIYFSQSKSSFDCSRTGEKVLGWRSKIRDRKNATSPYTYDSTKLTMWKPGIITDYIGYKAGPGGRVETYNGIQPGWWNPISHLTTATAAVEARALTQAYKKLREELEHLNSLTVLAEAGDVVRQFARPYSAVVNLINKHVTSLKHSRKGLRGPIRKQREKWSSILADTWLETSFGLMPLISDTKDIAEALARFNNEEEIASKLRSKIVCRAEDERTDTIRWYNYNFNTQMNSNFNIQFNWRTKSRCQFVCGLSGSIAAAFGSNDRLLELLGFNPGNWVPALWNALPWSFLADYFLNIGDILDAAVTQTNRVDWVCKTVSSQTTYDQVSALSPNVQNSSTMFRLSRRSNGQGSGRVQAVRTSVTRTNQGSLGVPSLVVESPFDNLKKVTNMAALLLAEKPSVRRLSRFSGG